MRRYIGNKAFKGTINVEFNSKEEAEEFMKKTIMFAGKEITDKQFLSEREKEIEEKSVVTEVCWLPLETIQLQSQQSCSNQEFKEFLKPYLNEYCYVLRKEGDNQGIVRFATSEDAAKAVQELKDKTLAAKPLKLMILSGKKANGVWTQIKARMVEEESMKREQPVDSEKRDHPVEEDNAKRVKAEQRLVFSHV